MPKDNVTVPDRAGRAPAWAARLLRLVLAAYRVALSPLLGPCCRFAPSCSVYASEAVERFGIVRGGWMAVHRLLRCHPFHPGGWDPVVGSSRE
jgi:putative membrane protein insertion efficiency factor